MNKIIHMQPKYDAGGEGSRGGIVIGRASSGKPIYDTHGHPSHKDFTAKDHHEAALAHGKIIDEKNEAHKKTNTLQGHKDRKTSKETFKKLKQIIQKRDKHVEQNHKHLQSWVQMGGLKATHPEIK